MENRGRKALTPLQKQINDSLGVPWIWPTPMDQTIYGFWLVVRKGEPDECWPWTRPPMRNGYGQLSVNGVHWTAHTFAYYVTNFGIEPGLHLDHVCHNADVDCPGGSACLHRLCCNPAHLEAVRPGENKRRANEPRGLGQYKTHCPKGHPLDGVLTRRSGPRAGQKERYCLTCNRERVMARKRRAQERGGPPGPWEALPDRP